MVAFVMAYSFTEPISKNSRVDQNHSRTEEKSHLEDVDPEDLENTPPMMVPMADILNHVARNNARLTFDTDALRMISVCDIKEVRRDISTVTFLGCWEGSARIAIIVCLLREVPQKLVFVCVKSMSFENSHGGCGWREWGLILSWLIKRNVTLREHACGVCVWDTENWLGLFATVFDDVLLICWSSGRGSIQHIWRAGKLAPASHVWLCRVFPQQPLWHSEWYSEVFQEHFLCNFSLQGIKVINQLLGNYNRSRQTQMF